MHDETGRRNWRRPVFLSDFQPFDDVVFIMLTDEILQRAYHIDGLFWMIHAHMWQLRATDVEQFINEKLGPWMDEVAVPERHRERLTAELRELFEFSK